MIYNLLYFGEPAHRKRQDQNNNTRAFKSSAVPAAVCWIRNNVSKFAS